jgi:hypothetical protein
VVNSCVSIEVPHWTCDNLPNRRAQFLGLWALTYQTPAMSSDNNDPRKVQSGQAESDGKRVE